MVLYSGEYRIIVKTFKIQKRIIRIIMNVDSRTSCHNLFKQLGILPLQSQYLFSLMMFVAKKTENYLQLMQMFTISLQDHIMIYIYRMLTFLYFKKECISLVLKFLITFQPTLNKQLTILISFKKP